jgi:hypothetical protein
VICLEEGFVRSGRDAQNSRSRLTPIEKGALNLRARQHNVAGATVQKLTITDTPVKFNQHKTSLDGCAHAMACLARVKETEASACPCTSDLPCPVRAGNGMVIAGFCNNSYEIAHSSFLSSIFSKQNFCREAGVLATGSTKIRRSAALSAKDADQA